MKTNWRNNNGNEITIFQYLCHDANDNKRDDDEDTNNDKDEDH